MFVNPTETFDTTGMLAIQPRDNESTKAMADESAAPSTSYSSSVAMTTPTAAQLSTPLPQNRFFVPNETGDQHIVVANEVTAGATSGHSTKFNSTSNMTSSFDSRNSSNSSFSVRFTTMKPCK
jgi:hypothetical protein